MTTSKTPPHFLQSRQGKIRRYLLQWGLDAFVTHHLPHTRYTTGFTGSTALLVLTPDRHWLIVDSRYTLQSQKEVFGTRIVESEISLEHTAGQVLRNLACRRVGYEPSRVGVATLARLRRHAPLRIEWCEAPPFLDRLRSVKDAHELDILRRAAKLTWETCDDIIPLLVPGTTEKEIAAELEYRLIRKGATKPSFETIVASGWRAALPHGTATSKKLRKDEFVIVDFGVVVEGYCSDMTRTFFLGLPGAKEKRLYKAVRDALEETQAFLVDGVKAADADKIARGVFRRRRLASYFSHSTGHGVGLEIHESPALHRNNSTTLVEGMVVTVEPGLYVPGFGGVRIEDMMVVGASKSENLTPYRHDLICL